jgi:hypothetical protein
MKNNTTQPWNKTNSTWENTAAFLPTGDRFLPALARVRWAGAAERTRARRGARPRSFVSTGACARGRKWRADARSPREARAPGETLFDVVDADASGYLRPIFISLFLSLVGFLSSSHRHIIPLLSHCSTLQCISQGLSLVIGAW